jgi:hypothetical protein
MPKPPFRKGIDPLIMAGLAEKATDPLPKFCAYAEQLYLDNRLLSTALKKAGIDPEAVLRKRPFGATVGSPGHHRKVFDPIYKVIARDQQARNAFSSFQPLAKGRKPH